ncbi:hypothetical protein JCM21714_4508 [Gracilibacillus boraciitolerans JCM 21714]|uniref:Uncharacterized protein n=1 Tax=Gracilibacillus boraciitolerans JCM 21714 TaxID=1298598 RepID=W4VQQ8_9BACI|nr:hypothetical protein [Gracilibacillus boraciitolerans]GAE95288.1 hypothetical protein JCM21714_4508 [Gracilibacillus boraciitolerans JCM 21714]
MKYSELELKKLSKLKHLEREKQIINNILNFIRMIHLNGDDFIASSYDSEFFGELPMTFRKKSGQLMGLITANVDGEVKKYVFLIRDMNRWRICLN